MPFFLAALAGLAGAAAGVGGSALTRMGNHAANTAENVFAIDFMTAINKWAATEIADAKQEEQFAFSQAGHQVQSASQLAQI